ncbi:hypothetical protein OXPF_18750 [Oxobacter pfennigii]|uniref:Uncharacterized protein n=1 Tax=Oxobacter pfennigii TaxID=36849 RepID=A0A0P8WQG2_9CLOT|nr:hypothetical protein [Oxobacter pfennigii]KPU44789.1 hypothetical protein OXPF_18750 [Oxobacter pfennigii]
MEQMYLDSLKALKFAELGKAQEERLKEFENQFTNEFGKEYFFMVMKKEM